MKLQKCLRISQLTNIGPVPLSAYDFITTNEPGETEVFLSDFTYVSSVSTETGGVWTVVDTFRGSIPAEETSAKLKVQPTFDWEDEGEQFNPGTGTPDGQAGEIVDLSVVSATWPGLNKPPASRIGANADAQVEIKDGGIILVRTDSDNDGHLDRDDDEEEEDPDSLGRVFMANTDSDSPENDRAETKLYVWLGSLTPKDPLQPVLVDVYIQNNPKLKMWDAEVGGSELPFGRDTTPADGRMDEGTRLVTLDGSTTSYDETVYVEATAYDPARLTLNLCADVVNGAPDGSDTTYYTTLKIDALAMAFNHDSSNAGGDGVNLRQHATGPEYIAPEWYMGPALSPTGNDGDANRKGVLYLAGKTVSVFNRIEVDPKYAGLVIKMKAVGKNGANPLSIGDLAEVTFVVDAAGILQAQGGVASKTVNGIGNFAEFTPSGTTSATVKREEATFTWEVTWIGKSGGEGNGTGSNEAVVTDPIMMYTVLDTPGDLWDVSDDPVSDDPQQPWATVLDTVTRETYLTDSDGNPVQWGGGAATVDQVAERITTALNSCQRFRYEDFAGRNRYVIGPDMGQPGYFDLTAYHNQITGAGGPAIVNCLDTAWGVAALSNLLGDSLDVMILMGPPDPLHPGQRLGFTTNPVCLIGSDPDDTASWTASGWGFHAVAWRGPNSGSGRVYDACLRFDADPDPAVITDYIPINMLYTAYASALTGDPIERIGFDTLTQIFR